MGCLCRGSFHLPPLPSLTEVVIACNKALPANPSTARELLALQDRMQQLREIRGISTAQRPAP